MDFSVSNILDGLDVIGFHCSHVLTHSPLDECLHPVCRLLAHFLRHMAVNVEGKARGSMSEVALNGLDVITALQRYNGVAMPLRYNYDKPEKPRISRVFGYLARFFILFQTEKSSREVVIS